MLYALNKTECRVFGCNLYLYIKYYVIYWLILGIIINFIGEIGVFLLKYVL